MEAAADVGGDFEPAFRIARGNGRHAAAGGFAAQAAAAGHVQGLFDHPALFERVRRTADALAAVVQGGVGQQAGGEDVGLGRLHRAAFQIGKVGMGEPQAHGLGLGERGLRPRRRGK